MLVAVGLVGVAAYRIPSLKWRMQTVGLKLTGQMPDLAWSDVLPLLAPRGGVWPATIAVDRNPHWAIMAPPSTPEDVEAGRSLFLQQCAGCHGVSASGGSAPGLASGVFRHGTSDWALFRNLRHGIPGVSAHPTSLDIEQTWEVIAFIRAAVLEANPYRTLADEAPEPAAWPVREVTTADLDAAPGTGAEWLTYSGSSDGHRHSPLREINPQNVTRLRLKWMRQLPGDESSLLTPLVVGDTMFVTMPSGEVQALDTASGDVRWVHTGRAPIPANAKSVDGVGSRGPAVLGHTLYAPTFDGQLQALDTRTGKLVWRVRVADSAAGYSLVGAPLVAGEAVIVGVAGTDRGVRGYLDAYAADDGRRLWRFYTVPGPGERGHETWGGTDAWRRGGGVTPVTGSYDPASGLVFWGVGTPAPPLQGDVRPGDNLYTSSVVAIEATTGRLRWHYQLNPHDERDWGATILPVLGTRRAPGGEEQQVVYLAAKNGFFYALDRTTGRMLSATPFARQTWNKGFESDGRPVEIDGSRPSAGGTLVYPGHGGAAGESAPSYDEARSLFFVLVRDGYANVFFKSRRLSWPDGAFWGGRAGQVFGTTVPTEVLAIDTTTAAIRWRYRFPGTMYSGPGWGGLLSTASGVVFAADKERLSAVDSLSGAELWHFDVGGAIDAAPISYSSDGFHQVTLVAERVVLTFSVDGR